MKKEVNRSISMQRLVFLAILIAMQLVVGRFSFGTNYLKISATFLVSSLIGYWYGPFYSAIAGGVSDVIGATLFPNGSFNVGFVFVAIFSGFVYGWFLDHRKMKTISWWRILLTAITINIGSNLILNTLLLHYMYGASFWPLFYTRLPKEVIMIPIYFVVIYFVIRTIQRLRIDRRLVD